MTEPVTVRSEDMIELLHMQAFVLLPMIEAESGSPTSVMAERAQDALLSAECMSYAAPCELTYEKYAVYTEDVQVFAAIKKA